MILAGAWLWIEHDGSWSMMAVGARWRREHDGGGSMVFLSLTPHSESVEINTVSTVFF